MSIRRKDPLSFNPEYDKILEVIEKLLIVIFILFIISLVFVFIDIYRIEPVYSWIINFIF
ncbi:MAG: hypothetical protein ACRC77_12695 [Bacteroidales bacterium]